MTVILSRDALAFEDGFHWLISRDLRAHVGGLTALLRFVPMFIRGEVEAVLSLEELPFPETRQLADRYKREHPEGW